LDESDDLLHGYACVGEWSLVRQDPGQPVEIAYRFEVMNQ
jgi:hypothetical protein